MKNQLLILKKIKFKLKHIIVNLLIKISLLCQWPKLTAIAFWLASTKMNPKCESKYTVLCMGRTAFVDDVDAMAIYSGRIKYITIWRTYFQIVFSFFVKGPEAKKLTETNYHTYDFCKDGKQNYYLFLKKMIPILCRLINFDAVLCCNFGYLDQQEIEKVCAEQKISYIVLHKEGLFPPGAQAKRANRISAYYKFRGDTMLVYNEGIMKELLRSGFSNITEDQFKVVGMPRLDNYFALSRASKNLEKQVLFFSFFPDDKFMGLIDDEEKMKQAYKRAEDFHKWVFNFAVKHPDIKVVVKVKIAPHYTEYINKIFNNNLQENVKNLEIINVGQVFDLIKNSTIVISFLSTTCLMAIAANKTLITPYFGDLFIEKEWDYFTEYPELINYAKTEEDLEKYVLKPAKYFTQDLASKGEFLKKFLGNADGRASWRAEDAILEIIRS